VGPGTPLARLDRRIPRAPATRDGTTAPSHTQQEARSRGLGYVCSLNTLVRSNAEPPGLVIGAVGGGKGQCPLSSPSQKTPPRLPAISKQTAEPKKMVGFVCAAHGVRTVLLPCWAGSGSPRRPPERHGRPWGLAAGAGSGVDGKTGGVCRICVLRHCCPQTKAPARPLPQPPHLPPACPLSSAPRPHSPIHTQVFYCMLLGHVWGFLRA
jgi:hypothetical protein